MDEPGQRYWQAIEPIWDIVDIYDGPDIFLKGFAHVERARGHLLAAHWCQSEVCNGGFQQFFRNSTGVMAPEAAAGFEAIGQTSCASLLRKATGLFGDVYPRDRAIRLRKLKAIIRAGKSKTDPFGSLEDEFFELLRTENGGFDKAADDYAVNTADR